MKNIGSQDLKIKQNYKYINTNILLKMSKKKTNLTELINRMVGGSSLAKLREFIQNGEYEKALELTRKIPQTTASANESKIKLTLELKEILGDVDFVEETIEDEKEIIVEKETIVEVIEDEKEIIEDEFEDEKEIIEEEFEDEKEVIEDVFDELEEEGFIKK